MNAISTAPYGRGSSTRLAAAAVCAGLALGGAGLRAQQDAPRFQSSVDVTTVDASVVDGNGRPITTLTPADFVVRVDGAPRRVVSAQWNSQVPDPQAPAPVVPENFTANQPGRPTGRLVVVAVDQPNIRFGAGTALARTAGGFIDKLTTSDRVSIVGFAPAAPSLGFTSDFTRAKDAILKMVGTRSADTPGLFDAPRMYNVGLSEAIAIQHDGQQALYRVGLRECVGMRPNTGPWLDCLMFIEQEANQIARAALQKGNESIRALSNLFTSLKSVEGPKTVVLITEGFVSENAEALANELGEMAASARVSLYVMRLDEQFFDMSSSRRGAQTLDDARTRAIGVDTLAAAARGDVLTVASSGATLFDRIQSEISGYYLLGIESDPRDRDGKAHTVRIEVSRPGALVRSRRLLANVAPERRSTQQAVAAGLAAPLPLSGLPLRVGTFSLQGPERGKVQMLIHADVGNDYIASRQVTVGYTILDASGRAVQTRRTDDRLAPVMSGVPSALQFTDGASLPPGDYTLKFVAAEGDLTGSVEHHFKARLTTAGTASLSELMVGGPASARESLTPTIGYTVSFGSLQGYMEAYGTGSEAVMVKFEVAKDATSPALITSTVPGMAGSDRIVFTQILPVAQLAAGRYVLRALVSAGSTPLDTFTRAFEIAPPAVAMTAANGASAPDAPAPDLFLPVAEQAFARPFPREEALKPDVVKAFLEKVPAKSKGAFQAGLAALTAGDYAKAEASFKSAIEPDADSTSAMAYVAVTLALRDRDPDAAGAWQTALIDGSDLPEIYDWLAQALLRQHSLPEAQAILQEATQRWPADARFTGPLASLYATFGRGLEAVRLLELYLEDRPNDIESARLGVQWLYQVRTAGATVHSRAEDVKLARAWATRYGNGPQQALVRQWMDAIEK